jgi:hypothetical protein
MTQAFNLGQLGNNVNSSGKLDINNGTTATLNVTQGGTGQTSYTNGQVLIGNTPTGGLTKTTLTAGTNISITNGAGSITISNVAPSGFANIIAYTSTTPGQSWTAPPTTTTCKVTVVGGGGAKLNSVGSGAGGASIGVYPVTGGGNYPLTVGAAGTSPNPSTSVAGGTSSFGPAPSAFLSATGGDSGAVGTGTGGVLNITGAIGGTSQSSPGIPPVTTGANTNGVSIFAGSYGSSGGGSGPKGGSGSAQPGVVVIEY